MTVFSRFIKILGVRLDVDVKDDCFNSVLGGIAIVTPEQRSTVIDN